MEDFPHDYYMEQARLGLVRFRQIRLGNDVRCLK